MHSTKLKTINDIPFNTGSLPIFTLYENPINSSFQYILRIFIYEKTTSYFLYKNTIEEIFEEIPEWAVFVPRHKNDDPYVVGSWV